MSCSGLPSFSILIETENLARADDEELRLCLDSMAAQDLSLDAADQVLLLCGAHAPDDVHEHFRSRYPWLDLLPLDPGVEYYEAKTAGLRASTGDIVVFCDSDCVYASEWLESILQLFAERPDVAVVAGETVMPAATWMGAAMQLCHMFPGELGPEQEPALTRNYWANNVAFRRNTLEHCPLPVDLALYRGHCTLHARQLRAQDQLIVKHPRARALHATPNGLWHVVWRFLMKGHDKTHQFWLNRGNPSPGLLARTGSSLGVLRETLTSIRHVLRERCRNRSVGFLARALPPALACHALVVVGAITATFFPTVLLNFSRRLEAR